MCVCNLYRRRFGAGRENTGGRGRAQDQGSRRVRYQAPNQAAVPGQAQGRVDFLESVAPVES